MLRFPLVVGILFIHAKGGTVSFSDSVSASQTMPHAAAVIQTLISDVFARLSVPLFFLLSGYLFFTGFDGTCNCFKRKLKTRVRSLLIPYIAWNTMALFVYFILQSIPCLKIFFSGNTRLISEYQLYDYLNAFMGLTITANSPVVYQFWFLRDLMVMNVLSPIVYIIVRYFPFQGLLILFCTWFAGFGIPHFNVSCYALFFFYLGAVIVIKRIDLKSLDRYGNSISLIYLVCALTDAFLQCADISSGYLQRALLFPGMITAWHMTYHFYFHHSAVKLLNHLSMFSFFVYAVHEPFLLAGLRKIMYRLFVPSTAGEIISIYVTTSLLTLFIAVSLGLMIRKYCPNLYKIFSGAR